ncbi:RloB domain-containing protein [Candidatus Saccharibacteria bacterium]|nr:RloB domain-containing protein [Candidatus Saccharibacteria bacterium]
MSKLLKGRAARRQGSKSELPKVYIFPEGETEKYYFNAKKAQTRGAGFTVHVVNEVIGKSGLQLVEETIEYIRKNSSSMNIGDEAYVVFDFDSNLINRINREEEIRKAFVKAQEYNRNPIKGIKLEIVLSNDSFELWYVLHFQDLNSFTRREKLYDILSKILKREYSKPEENFSSILKKKGDERKAIARAKMLDNNDPNKNPHTDVYRLVERLNRRNDT